MSHQGLVDGLPSIHHKNDICENYVFGKQHKDAFSKAHARRASKLIELVQCGPMKTPLNNSSYFHVFVDDYSRMTWVYFAKEKFVVLPNFKRFKNYVEKQSRNLLKIFRIDCGGEFVSTKFDNFCEEYDILRQLTT